MIFANSVVCSRRIKSKTDLGTNLTVVTTVEDRGVSPSEIEIKMATELLINYWFGKAYPCGIVHTPVMLYSRYGNPA